MSNGSHRFVVILTGTRILNVNMLSLLKTTATRLKLADFMTIAYSTPIGRQNKLGRPQMTHFLERDKDEEDNGYGNGIDDAYGVDIAPS